MSQHQNTMMSSSFRVNTPMETLREENEQQHLTICSLIAQNQKLRKLCKETRRNFVVSKKNQLFFKINQTKKYNMLLQTNREIMKNFHNMQKRVKNLTDQKKKLQECVDNVLNINIESVKETAICDGIDFRVDDFNINQVTEIEKEIETEIENQNEVEETLNDIESPPEESAPSTPPPEQSVDTITSDELTPKKTVSSSNKRKLSDSPTPVRKSSRIRKKKQK